MSDAETMLVPVQTRVITPEDNIIDIIEEYAKDQITSDDVVSIAESVLAITQGNMVLPEDLNPSFLARIICRFVHPDGSMSSAYGMQAVMDKEGEWRVFFAMLLGMVGKVFGKSGVFYKFAGRQARLVDDVTGNMPPFDKHIVYGPENTDKVVEEIKNHFSAYGAAIADVNDLKKAFILSTTEGVDKAKLAKMLIHNPFGNASEKTPIVIIKNYVKTASRLVSN